jgi:predicted transcriptional regulator
MKTPKAEEVIPILRSLIAAELVKTYGLRKAETARLLSVTPQAVTQYLKGVRALSGKNFPVSEQARKMVREYAGKIALKKRAVAETELLDLAYEVLTLTGSAPSMREGGEEAKMSAVRLLRQRLVAEQEAAEIFLSEAIKASDDMVRLLFRQIASDSIRHADIVQAAIAAVEKDVNDGPLPDPERLRQLQQLEEKGHSAGFEEVKKLLKSNVVKILLDSIEADEEKHDMILEKLMAVSSTAKTEATLE